MFNISNMLIWFANGKYIQDQHGQIILEEKPVFSFEYDSIKYYWNEKVYTPNNSTNQTELTQEQIQEIESFIETKRTEVGILGLCVDVDGNYLGRKRVDSPDVHGTVDMAPPTQDDWIWSYKEKCWKRQYFFTADKVYTRKNDSNAVGFTFEPMPSHPYFEFEIDTEKNTWVKKITPDALLKYKKETTLDLLKHYVKMLNETIENPQVILQTLKTLDVADNSKSQLIEKLITDIEQSTTINEIELSYELAKNITVA